ncbi:MAG: DUF4249 domain-containing protein [Bacteroidia bacterium]|nr:DUF4249 domain-containing protein [Bacteroidia bacterium]MDW8334032.1 DUF4249 domain-containing protein [Bacteroidia bacterium]
MRLDAPFCARVRFACIGAATLGALAACEEPITLKLNNAPTNIVIEGFISNRAQPDTVSVTRTAEYFAPNVFEPVSGALLVVSTDDVSDTLREAAPGKYVLSPAFPRLPGKTYRLWAQIEGKTYRAVTHSAEVVELSALTSRYRNDASALIRPGHYVTLYGKDPDTPGNCYRLFVRENDSLYTGITDLQFADDVYFNGRPFFLELTYRFDPGDTVAIALASISQHQYEYYLTLVRQLINGSPFAPPGDNLKTNIEGGAFGYFGALMLSERVIVIPP